MDLFIWYIRLLHLTLINVTLGPQLVMIRKMVFNKFNNYNEYAINKKS